MALIIFEGVRRKFAADSEGVKLLSLHRQKTNYVYRLKKYNIYVPPLFLVSCATCILYILLSKPALLIYLDCTICPTIFEIRGLVFTILFKMRGFKGTFVVRRIIILCRLSPDIDYVQNWDG